MIATVKSRYNTCRKVWDTEGIELIDDLFLKSGNVHETDIAAEQDSYTIESTRDYCGNVQYQDGRLSRIMVDGGYCSAGGRFYAFVQDYRGSVRRVGNNEYTYYPDGKTKDYSAYQYNDPSQRYQFCGMERDEYNGLDLYDFHARWYDQELCRFTTMDPLCEKYYDISPFAYCACDPVNYIDPTGMVVWTTSDPDEIAKFVRQLKSTGRMSTEGMQVLEDEYTTVYYDGERGMLNLEYCHPLGNTLSDGFEDLVFKYTFTPAQTQLKQGADRVKEFEEGIKHKTNYFMLWKSTIVGAFEVMESRPVSWTSFHENVVEHIKSNPFKATNSRLTQLSRGLGMVGITLSYMQLKSGDISRTEFFVDSTMTLVGMYGGPWGFAASSLYFVGKYAYEEFSGDTLFDKPVK